MNKTELAKLVSDFRRKTGLDRQEFADYMMVDTSAVSRWETGVYGMSMNSWQRFEEMRNLFESQGEIKTFRR